MQFPFLWAIGLGCNNDSVLEKQENKFPNIVIVSHNDGAQLQDGYAEQFRATVSDDDDAFDDLEVGWYVGDELICDWLTANPAGESICEATLTEQASSLIAQVRDPSGAAAQAEISVTVLPTDAPSVDLLTPVTETRYYADQLIQFSAIIGDTEDELSDLIVSWRSNQDGELALDTVADSSGEISDFTYLTEGQHAIELRVEDSSGKVSSEQVVIQVGEANSVPQCAILSPENLAATVFGDTVILSGTATDVDIPANQLNAEWSSDKDGVLGSLQPTSSGEVNLAVDELSSNTHNIILSVTDEVGAVCSDSVLLTVGYPPTSIIEEPLDAATYTLGDTILFKGTFNDNEDQLNELVVNWQSDIDGNFHSDNANSQGVTQFSYAGLSAGMHTITASVTDSSGLVGDDVISLYINTAPTAPSVSLSPSDVYSTTDVSVSASGSYDADGDTLSYAYEWYEDGVITANSGALLAASELDVGETWMVRVTVSDGLTVSEAVEASFVVQNTEPTLSIATISPNASVYNDTVLLCSATASDPDETLTVDYVWTVGGVQYSGSSLDLSTTGAAPGDSVQCNASVADSNGGQANTSSSVNIENRDPSVDALVLTPSSPSRSDLLTCTVTASDADGSALGYNMELRNQSTSQLLAATTLASEVSVDLSQTGVSIGDTISCEVTVSDAQGAQAAGSTTAVVINTAPIFTTAVAITPNTGVVTGTTLICSAAVEDPDDGVLTPTYTWDVGGNTIAVGDSLTLSQSNTSVGDTVTCTAMATDSDGEMSTDSASVVVENSTPSISNALITSDNNFVNDSNLTCTATISDADESLVGTYQWLLLNQVVETGDTVDLATTSGMPGDTISCVIEVTDSAGVSASEIVYADITNRAPSAPNVSVSPSNPEAGVDDLICTASGSVDADGETVSYDYQWTVDGVSAGNTTDTVSAANTQPSETWTCSVTPRDATEAGPSGSASVSIQGDIRPNVMICGSCSFDIAGELFPLTGESFSLISSCVPDNDTQALFVTRGGNTHVTWSNYLQNGGIIITEYNYSDEVFSSVFSSVSQGSGQGSCSDNFPEAHQYNPSDPFWQDMGWNGAQGSPGCGYDISGWPGVTYLAGWSSSSASLGYRDLGNGRMWLADFDWQDTDGKTLRTKQVLAYFITHGKQ